jgi:threonine/homoserine/homoserine lactone efflux protein
MTASSLIAFVLAASLVVITPGLDTALVLRTAASEGTRRALMAGAGIACGCLCWGVLVAVGLGAVLAASEFAYAALRWAGAAYLFYLGARLIASPRQSLGSLPQSGTLRPARNDASWLLRGLLTNLLNPKVGAFYVSFLPQFIPLGSDVTASTVLLAAIHALLGMLWFVVLVAATRPLAGLLQRPGVIEWLDRVTGGLFVAFGLRLAIPSR